MKPLNQNEIKRMCKSYQDIRTLRGVGRKHNRSPNTVKKYVSKFMAINTQNIVKNLASSNPRLIGTYVGLWMGDGTQYYDRGYTIKICSNKKRTNLNKFIQEVIFRIFKKKINLQVAGLNNSAYVQFRSKFVFDFIYNYATHDKDRHKTYTVKLKWNLRRYDLKFLEGCLLGLVLSDGCLTKRFSFSVVSGSLAKNMFEILTKFGFKPTTSLDKRKNKFTAYSIFLSKSQSKKLEDFLTQTIEMMKFEHTFRELKYGPAEI